MADNALYQRLRYVVAALVLIVLVGSAGYMFVEGWSFQDSFFMTVITLSTVGYGETNELTAQGRAFTSVLIFFCLLGMSVWTASFTSVILEGDISGRFERSRTLRMIANLKDHVVICGSDAMAQAVVEKLVRKRKSIVIVDNRTDGVDRLLRRFRKVHFVEGVATNEMKLSEANVLEANTVIAAMEDDVDNLMVGIGCKDLGAQIRVIARSNDPNIANSMRKAGIDEVISPMHLCGQRVGELMSRNPERQEADLVTA